MADEMGEIIAEQLSGDVVSNDNSQADISSESPWRLKAFF